jgi:tetratricopeptide (TPR) repeat protein
MLSALVPSINPSIYSSPSEHKKTLLEAILDDLDRYQTLFGDADIKTAETWTSLGLVRLHLEKDAQSALSCFKESLQIFVQNNDLQSVATTWNDLGICFERLQMHEEALKSYMKARDIFEAENFSKSHPCIVSSLRSISRLLRK